MNTTLWLIFIFLLPIFMVRWFRWLAIVQQKEYRIDRLLSFLKSLEGQRDLSHIFPKPNDFTRTGLKRPAKTGRVLIVALISVAIMFGVTLLVEKSALTGIELFVFIWLLLYLLLPLWLILACVPTAIVSAVVTFVTLMHAQQYTKASGAVIIGFGGSYGKTSTKHLVNYVLAQKFQVFMTPRSHNTKYSVARSICQSLRKQQIALIEYGAYTKGEIAYLTRWFPPQMAVETGFTLQHLGLFGSIENSVAAEAELVAALPEKGKVFCNGEDEGAVKIVEKGRVKNHVPVVFYSGLNSEIQLRDVQLNDAGELFFQWENRHVVTKIVGRHYVVNIQAAIAVALAQDLEKEEIIQALESFTPNASFVRNFSLKCETLLIDDGGTSNPKGFAAAIDLANELKKKQKILVTGGIVDLGDESRAVHKELAEKAANVFDKVVYSGVDGQTEFQAVFGENLLNEKGAVGELLKMCDAETLIVIEGRIPKWLDQSIRSL